MLRVAELLEACAAMATKLPRALQFSMSVVVVA
jgi:hypothetical protein